MKRLTSLSGYLAVIVAGLSCGAMLTGAMVLVPSWRAMPPTEFVSWFGSNADRMELFFGPLQASTILFTVVSAVLFRLTHRPGAMQFALASLLAIAVLATFPLYFRAANASFLGSGIPNDHVAGELALWGSWQWVRTAFGTFAFILAIVGVVRGSHEQVSA